MINDRDISKGIGCKLTLLEVCLVSNPDIHPAPLDRLGHLDGCRVYRSPGRPVELVRGLLAAERSGRGDSDSTGFEAGVFLW